MAKAVAKRLPFRDSISTDRSELVVFGTDVLSQYPHRDVYLKSKPFYFAKCARALPVARSTDLVVLLGDLNRQYYEWIRSYGLGPDYVLELKNPDGCHTLAEMIVKNPEPLTDLIKTIGRKPVYVPFFSGRLEREAAKVIGADLFGSNEEITLKYFDKESFKSECQRMGIPVVGGSQHTVTSEDQLNYVELERLVSGLLSNHRRVIIRGTQGAAGNAIYTTDSEDIHDLYKQIKEDRERELLVEPYLSVILSPNDQWVVCRDGKISHLGMTAQLFEGLTHAGNLKGQYLSARIYHYILRTSLKITKEMAKVGYKGVIGIDYIVSEDGIFPIENNARINGSSFTYAIVDNLERSIGAVSCWKFMNVKTEPRTFNELKNLMKPILYDGKRKNSVFPYDCDALHLTGAFAVILLAEDIYHIQYLEESLKHLGIARV